MKRVTVVLLVAVVLLAACKDAAKPRRDAARTPTYVSRLLRYQPANVPRYKIVTTVTSSTAQIAPVGLTYTLEIGLAGDGRFLRATLEDGELLTRVGLADMVQATVLLLPELPEEPVYRGDQWTVPLHVRARGKAEVIRLSHVLRYIGEVACPQRVGTCAEIHATDILICDGCVRGDDTPWLDVRRFRGNIILDLERGIVVESRLHVTASVAIGTDDATVTATIVATPVPRSLID